MRKVIVGSLVFALLTVMLSACSTTKSTKEEEVVVVEVSEHWSPEQILEHTFIYKSFQGKADINYQDARQEQSASLNLRMKKDEKIWASVVAMGIAEVGRALITPDQIQGMFRIGKLALDMPFNEGVSNLNAPISFNHLEDLLIGNPLIQKGKIENVRQQNEVTIFDVWQDAYLQTIYFNQHTKHINKIVVNNKEQGFSAQIDLSDYVNLGLNQIFAQYKKILITAEDNTPIEIQIRFKSQEIDIPVETPYTVPSSYKVRKNINF